MMENYCFMMKNITEEESEETLLLQAGKAKKKLKKKAKESNTAFKKKDETKCNYCGKKHEEKKACNRQDEYKQMVITKVKSNNFYIKMRTFYIYEKIT